MGDLSFFPGKRRTGLRAENLGYNLHEIIKPVKKLREPTPDPDAFIYAPPHDSSGEESEAQDNSFSENHSTPLERAAGSEITSAGSIAAGSTSVHISSSPQDELYVNPSTIRAAIFSSFSKKSNSSSIVSSPKRRKFATDKRASSDEDITSPFHVQPKRLKNDYGRRKSINIHKSKPSLESARDSAQSGVPATGDTNAITGFRKPETDALLLQVDQIKNPETNNTAFKLPPKHENSPRSVRASNRLSRNGQGNSKGFKIPTIIPSPKAVKKKTEVNQKFVLPPTLSDNGATPQKVQSRKPFKKPDILPNTGTVCINNLKDMVETTGAKHLPEFIPALPSSSMTVSSLPSTSNDISSSISSPISSPPSSPELDALIWDLPIHTAEVFREPISTTKCPICGERVDRSFFEGFESGTQRLTMRQQTRFCKAHNARSAETEWEEKGYPKIDWLHFEERLANYHAALDNILKGRQSSFYRNSFEDQLKIRQSRKLQHSLNTGAGMEGLEPGYYGSRGAKVMMENITSHFAPQLRRLAASDKLVSSRGVSGYVQAVLVPELAVMLVRDDMGVDDESARAVIRDSVKVGRLLCEEEDEVIRDQDDQEDELMIYKG